MQAPLELADMGLITIFVTVGILLRGRVNPMIPKTRASVVGALIGGFGLGEIPDFLSEGLSLVINSTRGNRLKGHFVWINRYGFPGQAGIMQ